MKKNFLKIIISVFLLIFIIILGMYIGSKEIREWYDRNIFYKKINIDKIKSIEIEEGKKFNTIVYDKNIGILFNSNLEIYNNNGAKISNLDIHVINPKYKVAGKYILIIDESNSNIYLIYNGKLQWKKELEGTISQITLNENGSVGITLTGTTYKTIIIMYDLLGREIFKTYLSETIVSDLVISQNNKYLSFIEINLIGTKINSKLKTISIEKAQTAPQEAIVNTFITTQNELLFKIKYNKNILIGMTDKAIYKYSDIEEKIFEYTDKELFVDIELDDYIVFFKEETDDIFKSKYSLNTLNIKNKKRYKYGINNNLKNIKVNNSNIVLNTSNSIIILNNKARVKKIIETIKHNKDIQMSDNLIGIIFKDKINLLKV